MFYKTRISKKGKVRFEVGDRYKDPLTGKVKFASVSYYKDVPKIRRRAERELEDKIDGLVNQFGRKADIAKIKTFGDLKNDWLKGWVKTVKPQSVSREKLVLKRLSQIIGDDYLLEQITPFLVKNSLEEYIQEYDSSQGTLQHIRSTLNKVFNHGVLYGILKYSPLTVVKVNVSIQKKREARINREKKFLEIHELVAFFKEFEKRRNPNYYDLAIFLLFTGMRIGEAGALTVDDIDFEKKIVEVNKSLQTYDKKVGEFYYDDTKTPESNRKILLPMIAFEAVCRVINRGKQFDNYAKKHPQKSFRTSDSIFRTEYGSPISSHSFREILCRVEKSLISSCRDRYGFEWKKHVVPHSFRHMHITYLQSGDLDVALREIMGRVGHVNADTTMIYTHRTLLNQHKSVEALDKFATSNGFNFKSLQHWTSKYSEKANCLLEENKKTKYIKLTLNDFKEKLGLKESYTPRHISANILPKLERDLSQKCENLMISTIREGKQKVWGYEFSWS